MNANLFAIVNRIVAEQGEGILAEPRRVSAFFADLAKDEPKPQKNAFVKCLEQGFAQTLKNVPEQDRALCRQRLTQRLHDDEGLDLELCNDTVELLAIVLFGEEQKKKENVCKNCGKELQEGWKTCPYCTTPAGAEKTAPAPKAKKPAKKKSQVISSEISSGSGSWGYGIDRIKPAADPASSDNTANPNVTKLTEGQNAVLTLVIIGIMCVFCVPLFFTFISGLFIVSPVIIAVFIIILIIIPSKLNKHFINKNNTKQP